LPYTACPSVHPTSIRGSVDIPVQWLMWTFFVKTFEVSLRRLREALVTLEVERDNGLARWKDDNRGTAREQWATRALAVVRTAGLAIEVMDSPPRAELMFSDEREDLERSRAKVAVPP
jgi:hypothetical protein